MGMPNGLLAAALLAFLAGAVSGLATWKRPAAARVVAFAFAVVGSLLRAVATTRAAAGRVVAFAFAVLGSLLLAVASVGALAFPTGATWSLPLVTLFPCTVRLDPLSAWFTLALAFPTGATWSLPLVTLFPCTVRLDPLSAWFTLTLAILGLAVSVYSWEYLRPMERTRDLGALGFFYNALLLGLALVFTAGNAFFFLSAWEVMAVSAFCLVVFEHEKAETRGAAVVYIIMSHAGTVMLLAAFLLLGAFAGRMDFASFHLLASKLPPAGHEPGS